MLDALLRPLIDPPLNAASRQLARVKLSANTLTLAGLVAGLGAAAAAAFGRFGFALVLLALSRILDGLDGALARVTAPTDRGAYLDIVCDYLFYAAIPLAFAAHDPARNALPAAALLASFVMTGASFLGFATLAAQRGLETTARGRKSFFYSFGLMEGTETIAFFVAMLCFPAAFPWLAGVFAGLCVLTVAQRSWIAWQTFAGPSSRR